MAPELTALKYTEFAGNRVGCWTCRYGSDYNSGDEAGTRAACSMASFGGVAREFDPNQESFGTYSRWLEQYLVANGVSSAVKKRATLLSVVGPRTFALLEDLVAPRMVSDLPYEELVTVLQGHFEPKSSEIVARFRFHSCCRQDHESVNDYAARLRRLAKPCQFAEGTLPEMLRDRLVCGIRDSRLQARLLSQPSLSLESALALACHGSSESDFIHKRNEIYHSIADGELISEI